MSDVADVLERAAALIEPEGAWTRLSPALDKDGGNVPPFSPKAVCWCLEGAIAAVLRKYWATTSFALSPPMRFLEENGIDYSWNDAPRRTQAQVVAKLRELAARARENADA